VYRARKQNQPVATIFQVTAPDGYSGNIRLLVGVNSDQSLAGVRVLAHKETPGLGDKIEIEKADWIKQFTGKSLINPSESQWAVKKDGGEFDQFSGATITPRAVVNQTKRVLVWAQSHLNEAFNAPAQEQQP
jgi:electron transport complex protein RnfG